MKRSKRRWTICGLLLGLFVLSEIVTLGISVLAADEAKLIIDNNGSRLVAKSENIEAPTYQWMIAESSDGEYVDISEATKNFYDITAGDEGKYIKVSVNGTISEPVGPIGKLVVFDIAKGSVTLNSTYSGQDSKGESVTGTHAASNIYVIGQSNPETMTKNTISFAGKHENAPFDVTLDNVNMGCTPTNHSQTPGASGTNTPTTGHISIPANNDDVKNVTLRLKGENSLRNITYYIGSDTSTPQSNVKSSLKITNINGDGEVEGGSLYIPKKLTADEIEDFVKTSTNYNHWNAGIGGLDSTSLMQNFEIAGGKIQVVTTLGDNCTAIGAGGNGYCQMEISGGEVIAHCNGTGAAIGGGIGWNAAGGRADILISGGSVYAKNHGNITEKIDGQTEMVGGVAIGSGSSFKAGGTEGAVTITGGTVEAYGTFGNGIGGGNSSTSAGGKATINISGGTVIASSIGGGNSRKGTGGEAKVTIDGSANVTLTQGIGGGDSYSGDGGEATITVNAGTMLCGGVIGGGNGGGTGNGGKAIVTVNSGILTATSIGGGTGSVGGNGGAAEIVIEGGLIETGSIGGGSTKNPTGKLGYAKANISGGDISGQFLMAAGGTEPCSFTMTGGLLHNVNTVEETSYDYVQDNGAAVYMDDPNGVVTISGGAIENCKAQNGGAVYMTAGTFTLSGNGIIQNCIASVNGGAVCISSGNVNMNGGSMNDNTAENGGAVYINGGDFKITGGSIVNNTVQTNGGAIAVNNGNYSMVGGNIDSNTATEGNGGGIFVSSEGTQPVTVELLSGSVSKNTAKMSGGALAVIGKEESEIPINVTIGVNKTHFTDDGGEVVKVACDHDINDDVSGETLDCPVISGNRGQVSGGAIMIKGNENAILKIYCILESDNATVNEIELSDCMKVEGGKVLISTTSPDQMTEETQKSLYGNVQIENTIYVTGGQIDIWGDMTNPKTGDIITVDTKKESDYFGDHRLFKDYYKLRYYENFTDPVTNTTTGQYKQKNIAHDDIETILGNIYNHPGYEIKGWNTDPLAQHNWPQGYDPNVADGTMSDLGWYEINESYTFDGEPIGDLIVYAIWEANAYTVIFDPNVSSGETYSGTMKNLTYVYDVPVSLPQNEYKRTGYEFRGWTKNPDGTGYMYTDGEEVVNLTTKKGDVVTLYAQWILCTHDPQISNCVISYEVIDEGKTLRVACSCGGYANTAALSAKNVIYDRMDHPASVVYSSDAWTPAVHYTKAEGENILDQTEIPRNAGTYTASVTDGGETASVTYVIEKAEQPAPNKPEYTTEVGEDGKTVLRIKHIADSAYKTEDSTYDSIKQYKITYHDGEKLVTTGWIDEAKPTDQAYDETYAVTYELPAAMTNYTICARYSEGTNYKESDETYAEEIYYFTGDVKVIIYPGEGISTSAQEANGKDVTETGNGVLLDVIAKDGYYLPEDYFHGTQGIIDGVQIITKVSDSSGENHETQAVITKYNEGSGSEEQYHINNIPSSCEIYITLPDAKRISDISLKIEEKQEFGNVTEDAAVISRDSAVTVYCKIDDFDPAEYGETKFSFNAALPTGTNLILQDKESGLYYWTEIDAATDEVELSSFIQMGTQSTEYVIHRNDAISSNTYEYCNLKLQLVIDFSEVSNALLCSETPDLTVMVSSEKINAESERVPELSADIKAELMLEHEFNGNNEIDEDDTTKVSLVLNPSDGAASKWDNRHTALVLTPVEGVVLPADAHISYKVGNNTTQCYRNGTGDFIIPLGDLTTTEVNMALMSSLIQKNEAYNFSAKWIAAYSIAEQSPINGTVLWSQDVLSINCSKECIPSVKVETDKWVYDKINSGGSNDSLKVDATVNWAGITDGQKITVTLMVKHENGSYISTGVRQEINAVGADSKEIVLTIPENTMAKQYENYCIHVAVDHGMLRLTEDACYFIIDANK